MGSHQRLVVCFDGTWNNQDDSTNVVHHFNLVKEGLVEGGVIQKRQYVQGVGTGVLDQITGGGFGLGLENNVREGYNWLVENYHDSNDDSLPDEIYVFGFSRGAYTARSLVGFIGRCGLLRRGAPLTVSQLWSQYIVLGNQHEARRSVWDWIFPEPPPDFRQITDLTEDPWQRRGKPQLRTQDLNNAERLLLRWSRRVKITYLGVYDTVGALGADALAIPGFKGKLAMHHNMRPTTLIQSCRHALAIDEHRGSFDHTPFLAFIGHGVPNQEVDRGNAADDPPPTSDTNPNANPGDGSAELRAYWAQAAAMWSGKIEQRWFVGAHSNIGGGYPDNPFAQRPLEWLIQGAEAKGLVCETRQDPDPLDPSWQIPRDSFAEFVSPFWTHVLRAKRNYRVMDPESSLQASPKTLEGDESAVGFSLRSINEQVDETVFEYWSKSKLPPPPNLANYLRRRSGQYPEIERKLPVHLWFGDGVFAHAALVLWATLAATGLASVHKLIWASSTFSPTVWLLCFVALGFPLIDWLESRVNFCLALGTQRDASRPRSRAFLDAVYWTRTIGFALAVFGTTFAIIQLWRIGWDPSTSKMFKQLLNLASQYWLVPVSAGVGVVMASAATRFHGGPPSRLKTAMIALVAGLVLAAVGAAALVLLSQVVHITFAPFGEFSRVVATNDAPSYGGVLLLLELAFLYFVKALAWCAEPMVQAHLGSITKLQYCFTPSAVKKRLGIWRRVLECRWANEDQTTGPAAVRMRELARETLWRDIIGLIPVYTMVFVFGMWHATGLFEWLDDLETQFQSLAHVPLWLLVPMIAAIADVLEDTCHLQYLTLRESDREPSALLTGFSSLMTAIKLLALFVALPLTIAGIIYANWQILASGQAADWRETLALALFLG